MKCKDKWNLILVQWYPREGADQNKNRKGSKNDLWKIDSRDWSGKHWRRSLRQSKRSH